MTQPNNLVISSRRVGNHNRVQPLLLPLIRALHVHEHLTCIIAGDHSALNSVAADESHVLVPVMALPRSAFQVIVLESSFHVPFAEAVSPWISHRSLGSLWLLKCF